MQAELENIMLTPEEFKQQWDQLDHHPRVTIPHHGLEDISIPEEAKRFLAEAGVPEEEYLGYPVNVNLPKLPYSGLEGTKNLPVSYERYRVFGDVGYRRYACLDDAENGRIVEIDLKTARMRKGLSEEERKMLYAGTLPPFEENEEEPIELIITFVNSSIQQLAASWLVTQKHAEVIETKEVWDNSVLRRKHADLYAEELRRIDPAIFAEIRSHWPSRVERIREGRVE